MLLDRVLHRVYHGKSQQYKAPFHSLAASIPSRRRFSPRHFHQHTRSNRFAAAAAAAAHGTHLSVVRKRLPSLQRGGVRGVRVGPRLRHRCVVLASLLAAAAHVFLRASVLSRRMSLSCRGAQQARRCSLPLPLSDENLTAPSNASLLPLQQATASKVYPCCWTKTKAVRVFQRNQTDKLPTRADRNHT